MTRKPGRMRTVERSWEWSFAASPAALWPVLADTARFNEAAGLPRYSVTDLPQPDGSVRRIGTARRLGLSLSWEEGVPNWIAGSQFAHERRFASGPLRRLATEIAIKPESGGGSRVRYRLIIEPRGWLAVLLIRLGFLDHFGRTLDRLFREAASFTEGSRERAFTTPPPEIAEPVRQRAAAQARALSGQGYGAADRLAAHLVEAAESDLERMRPRTLAWRWGREPREVIETCLAAAREGMLVLRWDLLCPRCRGAKVSVASLDQLPQGAHCPSCNIEYTRDFSRNVEVTFEPDPGIRALGVGTYCLASPLAAQHILIQHLVGPGETASLPVELRDGDYRVRTVEPGGAADFRVENGRTPAIELRGAEPLIGGSTTGGPLQIRNHGPGPRTIVIEDRAWAKDALTAHELTTMQAFRDLFADAVLRPGDQVEIRRVALLFTDIRGSSALYNRVGDARAYGWVREHYAVLTRAVRRHDGAVVKTIGDAVMAAFSNPAAALQAALDIRADMMQFDRGLAAETGSAGMILVKIGLHCGPCIAVTLNDRLDYFGRTVNLAARLQGESRGGDIVLSEAMATEPGMMSCLVQMAAVAETVFVKGFPEPVALRRIRKTDCLRPPS
jgi:class 3 adenylate cyclase